MLSSAQTMQGLLRWAWHKADWLRDGVARAVEDIHAVRSNDPAARSSLEVALVYPGVHALWLHRALEKKDRRNRVERRPKFREETR